VLPQGPAAAMLFYILVTKMLVYSRSLKRGFIVSGIGITLYVLLPLLGFGYTVETVVPEWSSFVGLLTCATLALMIQFSKARDDQKRLTNAIHHDMREPLRGIVSFSQLIQRRLSKRPEAESVKEYLGFAIDGGQRMAKMLDDLLLYSKNNHSEVPVPINLSDLVAEVQVDLYDLIERSGATIKVEALPSIVGFETQLKQLFQNLLSNALKFRQDSIPPRVIIRSAPVQSDASKFVIEIRDNGVGIPANQLDKVFGLFNRAHEGESYEGSGVGLALCRRIAIAHAATLTVASEPGIGTAFFFSLPIAALQETLKKKLDTLHNLEHSKA